MEVAQRRRHTAPLLPEPLQPDDPVHPLRRVVRPSFSRPRLWARNATLHDLSFCEEDTKCASCAGDAFTVEAATCAAGRCESRRSATDGSCTCDRAYEDTQGGGGRWACDAVRGCQWRRDFTVGLPSYAPPYFSWWAQDKDFASLYALYLLAVAASAFGVAASLLIRRDFRRSDEDAASTPFRAYLKALVAYFRHPTSSRTSPSSFSFTTWRCEHLCGNQNFTARSPTCVRTQASTPSTRCRSMFGGAWFLAARRSQERGIT